MNRRREQRTENQNERKQFFLSCLILQITHASMAGLAKGTEWLPEIDLELSEFAIVTNSLSKYFFFFR